MKIDFSQELKTLDGDNVKEPKGDNGKESKNTTLGSVAVQCLFVGEDINGEEKMTRFNLAQKIHGNAVVELDVKEAAKVRELIGKFANTPIVGPCWNLIDQADETKSKKK